MQHWTGIRDCLEGDSMPQSLHRQKCAHQTWIGLCSVLRPSQYSIRETVFTGQKTKPTVSKYWSKCYEGQNKNNKIHTCTDNNRDTKGYAQNKHNKCPSL